MITDLSHSSDLSVSSLAQSDPEYRASLRGTFDLDSSRKGEFWITDVESLPPSLQFFIVELRSEFDSVLLLDVEFWVEQLLSEISVICPKKKSRTRSIEPPNGA